MAPKKGNIPWNKGIPCSDETKKKISKSNMGHIPWNVGIPITEELRQKVIESNKRRIGPWKGKHLPEYVILKMILNHADNSGDKNYFYGIRRYGKDNGNWKGGIDPENHKIRQSDEYKNWRIEVFRRDYWTCQECGYKGEHIQSHHVKAFKEYPELRFDIDNGLTLCKKCHRKTFKKILVA